jgi:arylsulfatase A-like enzyme
MLSRARSAALLPLSLLGGLTWGVVMAHVARDLLAAGDPRLVGVELGVASMATALFAGAAVLALLLPVRRFLASCAARSSRFVDPASTGAIGLMLVGGAIAWGIAAGDLGGNGGGPLGILGVLRRSELDLRPVINLVAIALSAYLAPAAFAPRGSVWVVLAAALALAPLGLTVHEATALNLDPATARVVEHTGLAKAALAALRHATDRDKDGASPYFAGGDCDDHDPRRSPFAVDVPGNGIDEDCNGEDLALPVVIPVLVRPDPTKAAPHLDPHMNLVLITVDTMRTDVGFMGYDKPVSPNLDALAERGVVFDRAYAMASYTGKSIGPLLIGKYPSETQRDGGHFTTYFPTNTFVAERLHEAGFRTLGVASHWYFLPWSGLTQGFDVWDTSAKPADGQGDNDTSVTSAPLTDAAIRVLEKTENTAGRFFMWVHYFDPHEQYMPHPEAPPELSADADSPQKKAKAAYDAEVWYTDHHIGRLLEFIAGEPWGSDTAVVVTSDHGETFGEHGMSFHGGELWESLVRVPLLVYFPGAAPHHVTVRRSHVDVVPTILELLGVPLPEGSDLSGVSLLPDLVARPGDKLEERDVYIDMPVGPYTGMRHALITGPTPGTKLYHLGPNAYALFDLGEDPGETDDLAQSDPDRLRTMVELFNATRGRLREVNVAASTSP